VLVPDPKGLVRIAELRAQVASLARGGELELARRLLADLARADLALGLPAHGLLRARQAAELAEQNNEPVTGPLIVLAATLLAAGGYREAISAARAARAGAEGRARPEALCRLLEGAAMRRDREPQPARAALHEARARAAEAGEAAIAALALVELGWIDVEDNRPLAAATCFEFAAEYFRRGARATSAVEADALAIAAYAAAGDIATATARGPLVADAARALDAGRLDLVAFVDGVLAELALKHAPAAATQACALAAETAITSGHRELIARARLRQARAASERSDRARHLEAGLEVARSLSADRAGASLGETLVALVGDATRAGQAPDRDAVVALAAALAALGDRDLADLARAVLAEVG
jgi:hypothetical protein